jgi:hypothetical protein
VAAAEAFNDLIELMLENLDALTGSDHFGGHGWDGVSVPEPTVMPLALEEFLLDLGRIDELL